MGLLTIQHIHLPSGGAREGGLLVFHDGALLAVLACLDAPFYGADRGRWHVEAGFGPCATGPVTFDTIEAALRSLAGRCGLAVDMAIAPALAQFSAGSPDDTARRSGI